MKHTKRKLAGLALAFSLILATAASAKIAVGDYIDLSGYVGASARYQKTDRDQGVADDDSAKLDLDALKLSASLKYNALSAKVSAYVPGSTLDDANSDGVFITEAYLSYAPGKGFTVSGGRFLSWIGYEPFDLDQQWNLTAGLGPMSHLVPNYHDGVRLEYTSGKISLGVAALDSVYNDEYAVVSLGRHLPTAAPYRGDTDARNGLGGEFTIRYQDEAFSFGATLAAEWNSDTFKDGAYAPDLSRGDIDYGLYVFDFWAQYYLSCTKTTLGAEFIYQRISPKNSSGIYQESLAAGDTLFDATQYAVLLSARQELTDRWSVAGTASFGELKYFDESTALRFAKVAVSPCFALAKNIDLRAEASWTNYSEDTRYNWDSGRSNACKEEYFAGVQMVFKF
ncbi:MAG: porin [Opitutaceae bacterium]|nr:porin [Opitutaceae bacterium]